MCKILATSVGVFGACLLASTAAAQSWTPTGNLNVPRLNPLTTPLLDGRVLVAAGSNCSSGSCTNPNSAEIFNPTTGTWTLTPNMVAGHAGGASARLADGRSLVCGGFNGSTRTSISEIYDPSAGTWTQTGSMNQARSNHGAVLLSNGQVLIMGGYFGGVLSSAELFDPSTGVWSPTNSMLVPVSNPVATFLLNGKVLVAGGSSDQVTGAATAQLYDPISGTWSFTGFLNQGRNQQVQLLLGSGKVLAAGGDAAGCGLGSSAELYDPVSGTWVFTGSMNTPRTSHRGVLLNNGQVLVTGGLTANCTITLNTAEIYNPSSGSWTNTATMNQARYSHAAAPLQGGRVLVAGGAVGSNSINSAEIFSTCSVHGDDVEGDGDEQGDDGHKGHFHFCRGSGDMDFKEPDTGQGMRGHMDAVTVSGNQAIISGAGTLLDGTPVQYTAIVLGNAPVVGANRFAISWITSTGSSFHTSGTLTDGYIAVHTQ